MKLDSTAVTGDPVVDFEKAQAIADQATAVGLAHELFTVDAVLGTTVEEAAQVQAAIRLCR